MVTAVASRIKKALNAQCSATNIAQYNRVIQSIDTDSTLIFKGIALLTIKLDIYGPSFGWFISHSYNPLWLLRNKAAERRSKGVVGSTGRNIPSIPSPNDISPAIVRTIFIRLRISLQKWARTPAELHLPFWYNLQTDAAGMNSCCAWDPGNTYSLP